MVIFRHVAACLALTLLPTLAALAAGPTSPPSRPAMPGAAASRPRLATPPPARHCHGRWVALELRYCDLFFVPVNLAAGAGFVFDSDAGRGAFFAGVEVATFTYRALAWTTAEARVALYETCPEGDSSCSGQGSFFIGTRPGYAIALDHRRRHHLIVGVGMGWGQIGKGFRGRDPEATGLVVSPSLRYAYHSAFGLDLHTFFPAYSGLGDRYPMAISLTLTGIPTLILAALMRMR